MLNQAEIAAAWLERLLRPYAGQSAKFFSATADPFRNPIGQRFHEAISTLVSELAGEMNADRVTRALADIVEIRAVEAATPREALNFVFELKQIVPDPQYCSRIDEMALTAFDLYARCRERISQARINESKRRTFVLEGIMARGEM